MNAKIVRSDNDLIPPEELVQQHIGQGDFERIGEGMIGNIIRQGYLTPEARILDVGSGLGRLARPLTRYLSNAGEYHGMEISKLCVDWCQAKYTRHPNFRFRWTNVWSKYYNPQGTIRASDFSFPYADDFFDFAILASVFTHMKLQDADRYLSEIARVLRPGGSCFITYFLISADLKEAFVKNISEGRWFRTDGGVIQDQECPEKVVLLYEDAIREFYLKYGLKIQKQTYGNWYPRNVKTQGLQDAIWATK